MFNRFEDRESFYHTAQVCLNGHATNSSYDQYPASNADFCPDCGAKTITQCRNCSANIRGYYDVAGVASFSTYTPPNFCHGCGNPYPWMLERMNSARELAGLIEELSSEEQKALALSIDDLVRDTARTPTAATRFKSLMKKAGKESLDAMKIILLEVVAETAKKIIWPGM